MQQNVWMKHVLKALNDINDKGIAVIDEMDGLSARDVAAHVLVLLKSMNYTLTHYYHDVECAYIIEDDSFKDVEEVPVVTSILQ